MTSQPDPKDGPPDLPEPFWNALHEWSATRHESFSDKEHLRARMAFSTARVREEYAAALKAAALRVVPPEGGPRPDGECPCIAAIVAGKPPVCGDNCWHIGKAWNNCSLCGSSGVVRASGAGTRQEEPTLADVLGWLRKRPGCSWEATINDINRAIAELAVSRYAESRPNE